MANFTPKKIVLTNINSGIEYEDGDGISASALNAPIEASAYVQALATNTPDVSRANYSGVPTVEIISDAEGLPRLSFSYLKGEKGDRGEKGAVGNPGQAQQFTFIVDNDEMLNMWATNNSAYDYTSVLIKSGTYTSTTSINLSTTGTKVIVGEPDNLIKISNGASYAIKYDNLPTSNDYYIKGVNLYYNGNTLRGFYNCVNLSNCRVQCVGFGGWAFDGCKNIYACSGLSIVTTSASDTSYGFRNCLGVQKCDGNAILGEASSNYVTATIFDTTTCSANMKEYNSTYAVNDTANGGFNEIED